MFRRNFIASLAASVTASAAPNSRLVTYRIKGFTCVTCAVGLDTLLRQTKGVIDSKSSYPEATATIRFDPATITESRLKDLISEMGFTVV